MVAFADDKLVRHRIVQHRLQRLAGKHAFDGRAVVLDKLHPELVKALAKYVAARADDPKKDRIVVLSAYTKRALAQYGKLNVQTLEELAASCL